MASDWQEFDGPAFGHFFGYRGSVVVRELLWWLAVSDNGRRRFFRLASAKRWIESECGGETLDA